MPKKSQLEVVSQGSQQHNTSKKTEIKQFSSGEQIQNQPIKINKETHTTDAKRIHQEVNQSVIWTKLHPLLLHLQHRKHSLFTCIENTRLCKIPYTKVDNILNSTSCPREMANICLEVLINSLISYFKKQNLLVSKPQVLHLSALVLHKQYQLETEYLACSYKWGKSWKPRYSFTSERLHLLLVSSF